MSRTLDVARPILARQHALVLTRQHTVEGVHRQALKRLVSFPRYKHTIRALRHGHEIFRRG